MCQTSPMNNYKQPTVLTNWLSKKQQTCLLAAHLIVECWTHGFGMEQCLDILHTAGFTEVTEEIMQAGLTALDEHYKNHNLATVLRGYGSCTF